MTPADILNKAADVIDRNGWVQKDYGLSDWADSIQDCPVCARGGIALAVGRYPSFAADWPMSAVGDESAAVYAQVLEAEAQFAVHIQRLGYRQGVPNGALIEKWNDRSGMSQNIVVAEMRRCAANLRSAAS